MKEEEETRKRGGKEKENRRKWRTKKEKVGGRGTEHKGSENEGKEG